MGSRYGDTLGELLARKSRGEDVEVSDADAARLPLNRADIRASMRMLKRQDSRNRSSKKKNKK